MADAGAALDEFIIDGMYILLEFIGFTLIMDI